MASPMRKLKIWTHLVNPYEILLKLEAAVRQARHRNAYGLSSLATKAIGNCAFLPPPQRPITNNDC